MTADEETKDSSEGRQKKKRRVPTPRTKGSADASGGKRIPPRRVAANPDAESAAPSSVSSDSPAAQQAAAQQAATQQAAAQQAAAQQAAAQQAAAQQAAAQQAATQQAAAQQAAAKQTVAKQAAVKQAAVKQAAAKQAAAKQAAAQAAAAQPPGPRPSSVTPPAAKRAAAPVRAGRGRPPRRRVARSAAAGAEAASSEHPESPPGSRLPFILIGVGVLVVVVIVAVMMIPGPEPVVVEEETRIAKEPEVDPRQVREDQARETLTRIEQSNRKEPDDRLSAALRFGSIAREYADTEAGKEAAALRATLLSTWRAEVDQSWHTLKGDVQGAFKRGDFEAAVQLLEGLPKIFDGAEVVLEASFENELDNLRIDAREQYRYKKRLDELSAKAGKYALKGYDDIAIATIEALDERVEDEAPDVWKLKEDLVKRVQREGLAMLIEQEGVVEEAIAEARRLEEERKKAEREQRWLDLRESVAWSKKLSPTNLYNWVVTSDRQLVGSGQTGNWRVLEREGTAVLVGDNRSGSDMFIGLFSNHWEDYVCHFEVNIRDGALRISPRTNSRGGGVGDQTSPMLELGDDFPQSRWVGVDLEVHGDQVMLRYGDSSDEISLDPETTRLPSTGGFVFFIADGTRLEIRDVRVKLVSDTRGGGIWAR